MINIFFIFIGFVLLIKGADFLVDGSSAIAKKFNIPEIIIGLTIVAIGTSMPELVVSLESAVEGHSDIAIGNVIGSNISNMFLILGICSIIKPLKFKLQTRVIENPITFFVTILFCFLCNNGDGKVTREEGIFLVLLCIVFIIYNILISKRKILENKFEKSQDDYKKVFTNVFYILIGIIGLKFGGDLVIDYSIKIAKSLGVSEKLISLTIIGISTSFPELITAIISTVKGDIDLAIGNVLGSQIFNILLIIGASAIASPINYEYSYNRYMLVLILGTLILSLFPFSGKRNYMTRIDGIPFVVIYVLYIVNLLRFQ